MAKRKKNTKRLCAVSQGVQMEWIGLLRTCGKKWTEFMRTRIIIVKHVIGWLALLSNRIGGMHESKEKHSLSNSIYENWEIIHLSSRFMPRSHFERAFITQSTWMQKKLCKRNIWFRWEFWIWMPIIQKNRLIILWVRELELVSEIRIFNMEKGSRKLFPLRFCILPGKLLFN